MPIFSVVSLWEIAIKRAQGRADFVIGPHRFRRQLLGNDWRELPISSDHAILAGGLPAIHKDRFRPHASGSSDRGGRAGC
ncbi:hypothetical protein ACRAWD_24955 [Caulobacter segnis]